MSTSLLRATLTFQNNGMAKAFTRFWAANTLTGHSMSPVQNDATVAVTVYDVDDNKKALIDHYIASINN